MSLLKAIKYTESQLCGMVIPPSAKNFYAVYPQLESLLPGKEHALLQLLAWAYDPNSPLVRQYADFETRMAQARAQCDYTEPLDPEDVRVWVTHVVRSPVWEEILATENMRREYLNIVSDKITTAEEDDEKLLRTVNVKKSLRGEIKSMREDLKELYRELYAGDEAALMANANEETPSTPEHVARAIQNNKRK